MVKLVDEILVSEYMDDIRSCFVLNWRCLSLVVMYCFAVLEGSFQDQLSSFSPLRYAARKVSKFGLYCDYDATTNKSICHVCGYNFKGKYFSTVKRHYIYSHPVEYERICQED